MKKTNILKIDPANPEMEKIEQAKDILKNSGIVAFPTETVYGLGAVITEDEAVKKLFTIKKRPQEKKFAMCIYDINQIERFIEYIPPFAYKLMKKFWPGPLTLVLKADNGWKLGFRMPDHPVAQALLRKTIVPVFAPSANITGENPPLCAEDVLNSLDGLIDAVIDGGRTKIGISSTVCEAAEDYKILRIGSIQEAQIKEMLKYKNILFVCTGNSCRSPMAEGLMKKMLKGNEYFSVSSAGIAAFGGMIATQEAQDVMLKQGVDISQHRSQRLTDDMVKQADYILVMEEMHKDKIISRIPSAQSRIFLLKEFLPGVPEAMAIPDPIGAPVSVYEEVLQVIKQSLEEFIKKIL